MSGDLHNHSTCSDGSVPIHRLPQMAARVGLDTMAISDHDTLLSVRYCYEHPTQDGVRLIPATELTGYDYERHHRVHLLTFWPDPESPELIRHCDIMRQRRNECCLQSAREIEQIYPQFRTEQALEYAKDSGVLFKSGIMQALCELGLAEGIYGEEKVTGICLFAAKAARQLHCLVQQQPRLPRKALVSAHAECFPNAHLPAPCRLI